MLEKMTLWLIYIFLLSTNRYRAAIDRAMELPSYPYCYLGQGEGPESMSFYNCHNSSGPFTCKNTNSCGLDKCYVHRGSKDMNCFCNECNSFWNLTNKNLSKTVCGCSEGDSRYCWCDEILSAVSNMNHTYPDCYLGQIEGPGSMSFDHCARTPTSIVCNNSDTCGLDKCYGSGFQHENCSCEVCHWHEYKNNKMTEHHIECGCTPGADCWCNEIDPPTRSPTQHRYPDCYLGQIEGPGSMSFDHCAGSGSSFVCYNSDTCGLDKCYGDGFQHENCSCDNCHEHLSGTYKLMNSSIKCGCTLNADCWCD